MQENAPSFIKQKTTEYFKQLGFYGPQNMNWSADSPIKNSLGILKQLVSKNERQSKSKKRFLADNSDCITGNHV